MKRTSGEFPLYHALPPAMYLSRYSPRSRRVRVYHTTKNKEGLLAEYVCAYVSAQMFRMEATAEWNFIKSPIPQDATKSWNKEQRACLDFLVLSWYFWFARIDLSWARQQHLLISSYILLYDTYFSLIIRTIQYDIPLTWKVNRQFFLFHYLIRTLENWILKEKNSV